MRILGFSILATLIATSSLRAEPAAEQQVREAIKSPDPTVKCAFPCLNSYWQTASRSGRTKANRNWKNDDGSTFTQKRQGEIPFSGRRAAADSPAGASEWGGPI